MERMQGNTGIGIGETGMMRRGFADLKINRKGHKGRQDRNKGLTWVAQILIFLRAGMNAESRRCV